MPPQAPKVPKRPGRKAPLKGVLKNKPKTNNDKKRKLVIKKLVVGKTKSTSNKSLVKISTSKTDRKKIATKTSPKLPRIQKSIGENKTEKKRVKSPVKAKPKVNSPKGKSNVKTIKINQSPKAKKVDQEKPKLKKDKSVVTKVKSVVDSDNSKATIKSPQKDSTAKSNVKKGADSTQPVPLVKKEKDRSRSPDKKRLGVTRSSSAPLIPSSANSDVASKEHTKSLAINRTSKPSLENIANVIHNSIPTTKPNKKSPKVSDVSKDQIPFKSKESESKVSTKNASDKSASKSDSAESTKTIKTNLWPSDESKMQEAKYSDLVTKTPFMNTPILSPLGKKISDSEKKIVRPIARVKGTIIEKRVDLEKRKLTPSPAKNIEEKVTTEKLLQTSEKCKTETEKKKEPCHGLKTVEESKKGLNDKEQQKVIKSSKKSDLEKVIPVETAKNVMVVQPDISLCSVEGVPTAGESDIVKPTKSTKTLTVKSVIKRTNVLKKDSKAVLKRTRQKIFVVKKAVVSKKTISNASKTTEEGVSRLIDDSQNVPKSDPDNKVDLNSSKVKKCKLNLGKVTQSNRAKLKETIPKKIKVEPKEKEETNTKKSTKKSEIVNDIIAEVDPESKCTTNEESTTELSLQQPETKTSIPEKGNKGKSKKGDRSPSPSKGSKEKSSNTNKIAEEIKKEKNAADKSIAEDKQKNTDKRDTNSEDKTSSRKSPHLITKPTRKFVGLPSQDCKRGKKLLGFWTGPKRHREASLNALAKVQCLYENESRTHLELGLMKTVDKFPSRVKDFCKRKPIKVEQRDSTSSESEYETRVKPEVNTSSEEDSNPPVPRMLRCQPRGAGKYWEMKISSSEESEVEFKRRVFEKKKLTPKPKIAVKAEVPKCSKSPIVDSPSPKEKRQLPVKKRRRRMEVVMDLRDMVVKKRMASLNASAILAASYEKRSPRSGRDDTTSSESGISEQEEILAKKYKIISNAADRAEGLLPKKETLAKSGDTKSAAKSKVEVVVNQEADVTITGVYSTHHEGFCTVSGLQYRISATSHTQTTATASKDKEISSGGPSGGYTPLGALSSMHPPGGVAPPHIHQGPLVQDPRGPLIGSLGRKAGCSSAFSAPHHHSDSDRAVPPGYYQPAGPLITAAPLHGGFKDGGAPPPLPTEQAPQFSRYSYAQPQQVIPYGGGFGGQYGPHAHYGGGEVCYGTGRGPGGGLVLPAPPCYRPAAAHRTAAVYRHPSTGPGSGSGSAGAHDNQMSPVAPETYASQYCPPCYQHPHTPPRAPIACLDAAYQGPCPCPMQSCPKNVLTGPATGNPSAGGGPNSLSPPGGSRAPLPSTISYCTDDKRKTKASSGKDPPLLNQVLKNECNMKNGPELRSSICPILDNNAMMSGRSPKREYFSDQVNSRARQEVGEGRSGCCAVAINPSLSVMPPESLGPPSPARGSAGASIPQPPDPHPCVNSIQSTPISSHNPPQRRARVGKAMARKSIGADDNVVQTTTLLMCQPHTVPLDSNIPRRIASPLQVITDNINKENIDNVKNEIDSGDEVILLDSPNSKMAPIDLSSSEDNGPDNKSDKSDCIIVQSIRINEPETIIDLSIDPKKEDTTLPNNNSTLKKQIPEALDDSNNSSKCILNSDISKKSNDAKPKLGMKRRCSQPKLEIDNDVQITENLGTNGIGEHVKLQKRQKNQTVNTIQVNKKTTLSGSYKDLIKKPEKVFKLNNGKRQLNTLKVDKTKQASKGICLMDSDKNQTKKVANKRKNSNSPINENSPVKRKKLASSLLKYTDRKQHTRHYDDLIVDKPIDSSQTSIAPLMPKNKSAILLENLIKKNNNIDPSIENVEKNITEDSEVISDPLTCSKSSLRTMSKVKKFISDDDNCGAKNRTVLNINNNVVTKINETDCTQVPMRRTDVKLPAEKMTRTKSKSPAALNRKSEKSPVKNDCDAKAKCQVSSDVKDTKVIKLEVAKAKKCKSRLLPLTKSVKKKTRSTETIDKEPTELLPVRRLSTPRWSNGWTWEGEPQQGKVYVSNEETWFMAWCYSGMRHERAGDAVRRGDCVLLRAGSRRTEAPFVARVTQLWENPSDGEMMVSLLWYYRPEHTDSGRQPEDCAEEVFASRHRDANSVACIEDKCYVLTFNEYCRYRKQVKAAEENITCPISIVPSMPVNDVTTAIATNDGKVPFNISPDLVLFCRRVYDFRLKKIVRPPY
ncbi:histone gene-specific Epigenetic Repressor in late S phase [Arctopsyche grandis]|uniref:histone gene-specific Epigenetic Repressor in late S phase n=1 Tax=Arctopsyche grandis TaxID=121162 RepID=UPI00406D853C